MCGAKCKLESQTTFYSALILHMNAVNGKPNHLYFLPLLFFMLPLELQPRLGHLKHSFAIDEGGPKEFICPPMKRFFHLSAAAFIHL